MNKESSHIQNASDASYSADFRENAVSFFERHIGELASFCKIQRESSAEHISTLELLKRFIRDRKMPFDMHQYMEAQSEYIRSRLSPNLAPLEKQKAVAAWIKCYAEKHRDKAIEEQCRFLETESDWIVPRIEELLRKY